MRMVGVADGVFAMGEVDGLVLHHLDVAPVQDAVLVVREHVLDAGLARIEVVAHLVHVVGRRALLHHGTADPFALQGVVHAAGEHDPVVHVVLHVVGRELHVLVFHAGLAVVVDQAPAVGEVADHRVRRVREGGTVQRTLAQQGHGVHPAQRIHHAEGIAPGQFGRIGGGDLFLHAGAVDGPGVAVAAQLRGRFRRGERQQQEHPGTNYVYRLPQTGFLAIFALIYKSTTIF